MHLNSLYLIHHQRVRNLQRPPIYKGQTKTILVLPNPLTLRVEPKIRVLPSAVWVAPLIIMYLKFQPQVQSKPQSSTTLMRKDSTLTMAPHLAMSQLTTKEVANRPYSSLIINIRVIEVWLPRQDRCRFSIVTYNKDKTKSNLITKQRNS